MIFKFIHVKVALTHSFRRVSDILGYRFFLLPLFVRPLTGGNTH